MCSRLLPWWPWSPIPHLVSGSPSHPTVAAGTEWTGGGAASFDVGSNYWERGAAFPSLAMIDLNLCTRVRENAFPPATPGCAVCAAQWLAAQLKSCAIALCNCAVQLE
jgi:hypothetical protein